MCDSHADANVTVRGGPSLDAGAARSFVIRLAVAQGTQEEPEIQNNTCPAGRELDPECGVTPVGEGCLQHSSLITEGDRMAL